MNSPRPQVSRDENSRARIVVLGMMGRSPFGGQTWLYRNWLQALADLGHEVWYVEDDSTWPYDPVKDRVTSDCEYAIRNVREAAQRAGAKWAYRLQASTWTSEVVAGDTTDIDALYRSCDLLLNIVGATRLTPEQKAAPFRVYVETDPVSKQLLLAKGDVLVAWMFEDHHLIATYGENYGKPDCGVPLMGLEHKYITTRQPIDVDWWNYTYRPDAKYFTTIGNYRQFGHGVVFRGQVYRWSKHHEWMKFIDLPSIVGQDFRLAMQMRDYPEDQQRFEAHGWEIVPSFEMSLDIYGGYPDFIRASRAEFTVAKDQNIRLRSGWFSERDACYLASGKPVVTQDTGFGVAIPTGKGLFAIDTLEDAAAAIEDINGAYEDHCRAARGIAEDCFSGRTVAAALLRDVGLG